MKIKITYSWGDEEEPIVIPEGKNPWKYMRDIALNEAEESFAGNEDCGPIGLETYKEDGRIILTYNKDYVTENDRCFYELVK